jgi:MFS family permease
VSLWPHGGLWRQPDFLRLWGAQTISQFGSQITLLGLPLVAVLVLDASAFEVALLGVFDFLPFLIFSLPAGVWVDRLPRKPILVLGDLGRAVVLLTVPVAALLDALTMWQLYAVGFAAGTLTVFFDVAYQSYLPSLVTRQQLVEGNSKLEVSRAGAQVAGPGVAGALVGALTAPYAILVDAISFVWSGLLLLRINTRELVPEPTEQPSMRRELLEGLRYILRDARWRAFTIYVASVNFCTSLAFAVFIVYAVRDLGMSAVLIGVVFAVGNLGPLLGAVLAGRIGRRFGPGPTVIAAAAASGPPILLIPLAPESSPAPFLILSNLLTGAAIVTFNVTGISLIQALTPARMLGRMNASRRFMVWGTIPLGSLTGGVLATVIGLRETIFIGGLLACFCFLPLLFSPIRSIRELPAEDGDSPIGDARLPLETQVTTDA